MSNFIEVTITRGQKTMIAVDTINSIIDVKDYREIHTDRGVFTVEESYDYLKNQLEQGKIVCD